MDDPFEKIDMLISYYSIPVIESLSDYDKGVHDGRKEGLLLAKKEIITWVKGQLGE